MGAAAAHPPPNLPPMSGPSMRPNEPTTTGLPSGPGPGPEVLGQMNGPPKVSQMYLSMYQSTKDPQWARLAEAALARGQ